ncbi:ATP-binding protein [Haliscomenobacter sp.]|uniref:ATP-binding protein n=1 Tax=Haliscomenobacter sp. TaxID=2717303 RepID=UPI003BAB20B8
MTPNLPITLSFLAALIRHCLNSYFPKTERDEIGFEEPPTAQTYSNPMPPIPTLEDDAHPFTRLVLDKNMTVDEYVVLSVSLVHHLQPDFFDSIISEFIQEKQDFLPLGGVKTSNIRSLQPTAETALFLLAGQDLERRIKVMSLFDQDHFFAKERILMLEEMRPGEPESAGRLILDPEWVDRILYQKVKKPRFNSNFPAELIETKMDWTDLVLPGSTLEEVQELLIWLKHGQSLLEDTRMGKRLKPGYRALFWGPPGTGKTLTAALLGKGTNRDVYKIDLSLLVSKYIGETEKNLSNLFDKAEDKNWILFFDEADALFGKRTNVKDAHDKYANQEVSYLLQRVENFNGLVILASNFKSNIDDAFVRRFQSIIHFPMPKPAERLRLWEQSIPLNFVKKETIDFQGIAQKYELSGASILNVVQYACLKMVGKEKMELSENFLREGIIREFGKEGKVVQ